jgi:hypothetical protein
VLPPFSSFQVIMHHKLPDSDADGNQREMTDEEERFRELRLMFFPNGGDRDVYYHFSRPKIENDPDGKYKWRANSQDEKQFFAVPADSNEIVVVDPEEQGTRAERVEKAVNRFLATGAPAKAPRSRARPFAPMGEPATSYPPGITYPPGLKPPLPQARKAAPRAPRKNKATGAATRATGAVTRKPVATSRAASKAKPPRAASRAKPARAASGSKKPASGSKKPASGSKKPASGFKMNAQAPAFSPAKQPRAMNAQAPAFTSNQPVPGYIVPPPPPPPRRRTVAPLNANAAAFVPAA